MTTSNESILVKKKLRIKGNTAKLSDRKINSEIFIRAKQIENLQSLKSDVFSFYS